MLLAIVNVESRVSSKREQQSQEASITSTLMQKQDSQLAWLAVCLAVGWLACRRLSEKLCDVVQDYNLVRFVPLAIQV